MKKETVTRNNAMFFITTVGMGLGLEYFAQAVMHSFRENNSHFPTDNLGCAGYVKIDSSALWVDGRDPWDAFAEKVRGGLLTMLSYGFSSATIFEGDFAEQVTLKRDGYTFSFHIRQYERDADHSWEIIGPENLEDIPENEKLGRVVYLSIKPETN